MFDVVVGRRVLMYDIDTLGPRLAEELSSTNATYVSDVVFGVWARMSSRLPEER
jgi:hypothetical protein